MMLGVSGLVVGDGVADGGGGSELGGSGSVPGGGVEESERSGGGGGGNRWPRQETLALLKIRSDMDVTFRDTSLKGPLWAEVSRKMADLGFQRSSKKCKEKFENVYKYHKRTKDGRASKPDGKTYRFFDQLAALENTPPNHFTPPPPATTTMAAPPLNTTTTTPMPSHATVSSTTATPLSVVPPKMVINPMNSSSFQPSKPPLQQPPAPIPPQSHGFQPIPGSPLSNSTSSSTSSDEDIQRRRGRKRKWKDYFGRLMNDVIRKQEELQKKFLETLEKRERDRIAREEAWRVQEMARMNREHHRLVQERSIASATDAAVIALLQKVTTGEHAFQIPININSATQMPMSDQQPENAQPPLPQKSAIHPPAEPQQVAPTPTTKIIDTPTRESGGGDDHISASSSRWPKAEIEALIKLRTGLELKYQDNGPKGPLWEEISKSMGKLGYNRNAKRCKEKWENINKYFKKVKESNKKRPEDSKTCPYFHQLEAIYKEKARNHAPAFNNAPILARPEQQWPQPEINPALHDQDQTDNDSQRNEHDDDYEDDEDKDEDGDYEMIANKQLSAVANAAE